MTAIEKNIDISIESAWREAFDEMNRLGERGARRVFNSTPSIASAFILSKRSLVCVDEGIREGIHLPGSGVLLSDEDRRRQIAQAGIEEFTTHDNCGAFKLAFPRISGDRQNLACKDWGRAEASRLGIPFRHIGASEMDRPSHLHTATVIYYDGTGTFNRIAGLPKGFVVSRGCFKASAKQDLELCLKIALGDHGFGKFFTSKNPLHVVLLAHPTDRALSLGVLESEVREVVSSFGRCIEVSGIKTAFYLRDRS